LKKLLVVTYGGGHARMLKPVVSKIIKNNVEVSILALNTAEKEFEDIGVDVLGYRSFFRECPRATRYGEELAKTLEKVINYEETVCYLGQNFLELVETYGEEKAREMYANGGRYIFEPLKTMEYILDKISPDMLLSTNSPRSERCAVLAARKLNIKSAVFVDMFGIRCSSWFSDSSFADKIFVLSESVKQHFLKLGRAEDEIVVTGNPSFDVLVQSFNNKKKDIEKIRASKPFTVLWASQPEPSFLPETGETGDENLPFLIEEKLLEIFESHRDWKLIARNHPSEVKREYPEFVKVSSQRDDLNELFSNVHVVLTPSSTLGFQGMIMGAKLVTIDVSVLTPTMPYAEMGFSIGLNHINEIESALENIATTIEYKVEPAYNIDNAAQTATVEIIKILEKTAY